MRERIGHPPLDRAQCLALYRACLANGSGDVRYRADPGDGSLVKRQKTETLLAEASGSEVALPVSDKDRLSHIYDRVYIIQLEKNSPENAMLLTLKLLYALDPRFSNQNNETFYDLLASDPQYQTFENEVIGSIHLSDIGNWSMPSDSKDPERLVGIHNAMLIKKQGVVTIPRLEPLLVPAHFLLNDGKCVGQGSYGTVVRLRDPQTGKLLNTVRKRIVRSANAAHRAHGLTSMELREIQLPSMCPHDNIIKYEHVHVTPSSIYLFMPAYDGHLKQLRSKVRLEHMLDFTKACLTQILSAVAALGAKNVTHRDLKPQNILYDLRTKTLVVADFGLARVQDTEKEHPQTPGTVTLWYRAPEVLLGGTEYGLGVDEWSVGCIAVELVTGVPWLRGDSEIDQLFKIVMARGTLPRYFRRLQDYEDDVLPKVSTPPDIDLQDNILNSIVQELTDLSPGDRMSAIQALQRANEWPKEWEDEWLYLNADAAGDAAVPPNLLTSG